MVHSLHHHCTTFYLDVVLSPRTSTPTVLSYCIHQLQSIKLKVNGNKKKKKKKKKKKTICHLICSVPRVRALGAAALSIDPLAGISEEEEEVEEADRMIVAAVQHTQRDNELLRRRRRRTTTDTRTTNER